MLQFTFTESDFMADQFIYKQNIWYSNEKQTGRETC